MTNIIRRLTVVLAASRCTGMAFAVATVTDPTLSGGVYFCAFDHDGNLYLDGTDVNGFVFVAVIAAREHVAAGRFSSSRPPTRSRSPAGFR